MPLAEFNGAQPVLLGIDGDGPVFADDEDPPGDGRPRMVGAGGMRGEPPVDSHGDRVGVREAAAGLPADGGLAAYTAALLNWHRRHGHCSVCGAPSDVAEGGLTRLCPNCGSQHHPRTDPVVIMLVIDADRLLLGRQPAGRPAATPRWPGSSSRARASRRPWRAKCARRPAWRSGSPSTSPRSRGRSRPR